jgi:hypothetical protein
MKIDTGLITDWKVASKTRPIKAKPLSLLVDPIVEPKLLLETLEGNESLRHGAVICIGEVGDVWQQMPEKLLKKYSIKAIDDNGWSICEPLLNNAVNVFEVTEEFYNSITKNYILLEMCTKKGDFYINGQWGDDEHPFFGKNVQWGFIGDFICQNQTDPSDVWIVKRKLFLNTYVIKS